MHSERIVLLRSFKERNVILHSFFEFLATYETPKEQCVLLRSFLKNAKNATFICKERIRMQRMQRTQRTQRSFAKNAKERKRMHVLLKRMQKNIRERAFFYKERKRMQRLQGSFIKNIKECKEHNVLL